MRVISRVLIRTLMIWHSTPELLSFLQTLRLSFTPDLRALLDKVMIANQHYCIQPSKFIMYILTIIHLFVSEYKKLSFFSHAQQKTA
jgi:hypothetical protein